MTKRCISKVLPNILDVDNLHEDTTEDTISSKKQKTLSSDLKGLTTKFNYELTALKTKHEAEIEVLISNHRSEMDNTTLNAETNYDTEDDVDGVCNICGMEAADEIGELTYCLRCKDVLCGDCSSKCKDCDDAFCSDCVSDAGGNIKGVEIPGGNGTKVSVIKEAN